MKSLNWFVYIIKTDKGHLYTGITTDIERRFKEHQSGIKGAKYFRGSTPVEIVFQKSCLNRSEASKCESYIKSLKRSQKLEIVEKGVL